MSQYSMTPEERATGLQIRARLEAHRRAKPGDDLDALTGQMVAEQEAPPGIDDELAGVAGLVASAPQMTADQAERIRALWNTSPPPPPPAPEPRDELKARLADAERKARSAGDTAKRLRAQLAALDDKGSDR
jgi:hypothetical protein